MATIIGTELNDVLFGSSEDDFIDAGAGDDGMNGGLGNDTYVVKERGDEVFEALNQGIDKVIASVDYVLPENVDNLNLTAGITGYGNSLDNLIQANDADNILIGLKGNDLIYGFKGNDVINGNAGNDRIYAGEGDDILTAGRGYDELYGGAGDDTYRVSSYAFKIVERIGQSSDTLEIPFNYELAKTEIENLVLLGKAKYGTGSTRNNAVSGNGISNVLSGLQGDDALSGYGGNDMLYGNQGDDLLKGGEGNDQLYGQEGNDTLFGDRGNDKLSGEAGKDVLTGFGGGRRERDELVGGEGADIFVIGALGGGGAYYLGSGYAKIIDFQRSQQDKIQVGNIKDYRLVTNKNILGSSALDAAIFKGRDLIAVVQDNRDVSIRDLMAAPLQPPVTPL